MVYVHGSIWKSGYSILNNELIATMPSGARPAGGWWTFLLATTENGYVPLAMDANAGLIYIRGTPSYVCFTGMSYKT